MLQTSITFESGTFKKMVEVTDDGEYDVELPVGNYLITVERPGFKLRRMKFKVESGMARSLSFILDVAVMEEVKCPKGKLCL